MEDEFQHLLDFEESKQETQEALELSIDKQEAKNESDTFEIQEEKHEVSYELTVNLQKGDMTRAKSIEGMIEILQRENYFATNGFSGELYVYISKGRHAGKYIEASQAIKYAIKMVAEHYEMIGAWANEKKRKEVGDFINSGLKVIEEPDLRHINVGNGLVYLGPDGSFISFVSEWTPDYLTTLKLPFDYDKNAKCPAWEQFIKEVFPEDSQHVAWQIAALLMVPLKNKAASGIILKGPKNSGKSTFLNGITAFLGYENVCSLSIDRFGERFQDAQLMNKLANIVGELPNTVVNAKAVNVIKQLIGNDTLSGELKYGSSFTFKSYARCLFSCNNMPRCEVDEAFFDRFYVIPFISQFSKNPIKEASLNAILSSPSELSGLFNKALKVLPSVFKDGIQATRSMKAAMKETIQVNDVLIQWIEDNLDIDETASRVFEEFRKEEPNDRRAKSNVAFGMSLRKLLPKIKKGQLNGMNGNKISSYVGIRLRQDSGLYDEFEGLNTNDPTLKDMSDLDKITEL